MRVLRRREERHDPQGENAGTAALCRSGGRSQAQARRSYGMTAGVGGGLGTEGPPRPAGQSSIEAGEPRDLVVPCPVGQRGGGAGEARMGTG